MRHLLCERCLLFELDLFVCKSDKKLREKKTICVLKLQKKSLLLTVTKNNSSYADNSDIKITQMFKTDEWMSENFVCILNTSVFFMFLLIVNTLFIDNKVDQLNIMLSISFW